MMKNRKLIVGVILAAFWVCTYAQASDSNLTPLPGNPLRKVILDALRQEVRRIHGLEVVFVVRHLKVKDGWAWVHTLPQSADGANRYEDISALLQLQGDAWSVAEIACGEEENPDCLNAPEYFAGLQRRFPGVATEVFPGWARLLKDQ